MATYTRFGWTKYGPGQWGRGRRGRLGIPPVNPNPRPPNEQRIGRATALTQRAGVGDARQIRQGIGSGTAVAGPGARPTGGTTPPPTSATAPPPDPRDDQYWRDITRLQFERNSGLAQLNTEGVFARTSYEQALAARARSEPLEQLNLRQQANRGGAIYSTATSEALGQLAQNQFQQRSELESEFNADRISREMEMNALRQGYSIDEAQALGDAVARTAQLEANRPPPVPDQQGSNQNTLRRSITDRVHDLQRRRSQTDDPARRKALAAKIRRLNQRKRRIGA